LHDRLKMTGAALAVKTVDGLIDNKISGQPQKGLIDEEKINATHAPKIFTETCKIDWSGTAEKIYNLIRGLSPFPGAFTQLQGKLFKIYRAEKKITAHHTPVGDFDTDHKTFLRFACADGYIYAKDIQAEGKKRMLVEEFLRGFREV
nr:methionyl-tRNA formyltransferase [Chitinophagaceae bacterium]